MNNHNKALILTVTAIVLVCMSYTVGLHVDSQHAAAASSTASTVLSPSLHDEYRMGVLSTVYAICNESRISATINETQCGDIQDSTQTEYLCKENNSLSTTYCWTEDKSVTSDASPLTFDGSNQ